MITVKLKNKYIYFAIDSIFHTLDPRFSTHLWNLITINSDEEFEQTVQISKTELVNIYVNVSKESEGVAASINKEINDILLPQLIQQSNLTQEQLDLLQQASQINNIPTSEEQEILNRTKLLTDSNEIADVFYRLSKNNVINYKQKLSKIQSGKSKILKPYV